jgi:hypothetical protein
MWITPHGVHLYVPKSIALHQTRAKLHLLLPAVTSDEVHNLLTNGNMKGEPNGKG